MNYISPRPWRLSEWFCADVCAGDKAGTHIMRGLNPSGSTGLDYNSRHAVACVNALHFAGITPAALAADPEVVKKLVEAAKNLHEYETRVCQDDKPENLDEFAAAYFALRDALRACGIEVGP